MFAAGDYCALGALQEAHRQGLRVPEDVAISGFSNETFTVITQPPSPPSTSAVRKWARPPCGCCWS
ncbi:substrate-binding domain-containing protein [Hymenobacter sp. 5516J-16]|uniref:substrate-binding domain-containing protein n=1 Tax=Hymenobacter sp. 5516J-16 TaxID=2932253 RepID=UPI00397CBC9F